METKVPKGSEAGAPEPADKPVPPTAKQLLANVLPVHGSGASRKTEPLATDLSRVILKRPKEVEESKENTAAGATTEA